MLAVRNIFKTLNSTHTRRFKYCFRSVTQNMDLILYGDEASPPVRFVMMTASLLEVKLKLRKIDLFLGENKSELYTKINHLQKVPALDTGEQVICDSHAIALYLCRRSRNQDLYPEDSLTRAKVEQMLFFNSGSLFPADSLIFTEYFAGKRVDNSKIDHWHKLLDYLEKQLKTHSWLAGDKMMLCDLCCGTTVSSLQLLVPLTDYHVKVTHWMKKLQQQPCFEINSRGLKRLASFVENNKIVNNL